MVLNCGRAHREPHCNGAIGNEAQLRQQVASMSLAEGDARERFCSMLAGGDAVKQFQAGLINGCTLLTLLNQEMHHTLPPEARFGPSHPVPLARVYDKKTPEPFGLPPPMLKPAMYADKRLEAFATQCASYGEEHDSCFHAISKWGERFPFGCANAPEPPWHKDKQWPQNRWRFKTTPSGCAVP